MFKELILALFVVLEIEPMSHVCKARWPLSRNVFIYLGRKEGWVTPSGTQRLLMILYTEVILGSA